MQNRLILCQRGLFRGEFVVTSEQCSFSIGDCIEVFQKEAPYDTGETIISRFGKELPIIVIPLTVVECCHTTEITVVLQSVAGRSLFHWIECLDIGKISTVVPFKYQYREHIWYMPKIDGWVPGMFGKVQAPSQSNR